MIDPPRASTRRPIWQGMSRSGPGQRSGPGRHRRGRPDRPRWRHRWRRLHRRGRGRRRSRPGIQHEGDPVPGRDGRRRGVHRRGCDPDQRPPPLGALDADTAAWPGAADLQVGPIHVSRPAPRSAPGRRRRRGQRRRGYSMVDAGAVVTHAVPGTRSSPGARPGGSAGRAPCGERLLDSTGHQPRPSARALRDRPGARLPCLRSTLRLRPRRGDAPRAGPAGRQRPGPCGVTPAAVPCEPVDDADAEASASSPSTPSKAPRGRSAPPRATAADGHRVTVVAPARPGPGGDETLRWWDPRRAPGGWTARRISNARSRGERGGSGTMLSTGRILQRTSTPKRRSCPRAGRCGRSSYRAPAPAWRRDPVLSPPRVRPWAAAVVDVGARPISAWREGPCCPAGRVRGAAHRTGGRFVAATSPTCTSRSGRRGPPARGAGQGLPVASRAPLRMAAPRVSSPITDPLADEVVRRFHVRRPTGSSRRTVTPRGGAQTCRACRRSTRLRGALSPRRAGRRQRTMPIVLYRGRVPARTGGSRAPAGPVHAAPRSATCPWSWRSSGSAGCGARVSGRPAAADPDRIVVLPPVPSEGCSDWTAGGDAVVRRRPRQDDQPGADDPLLSCSRA